jgi:hypothetical protein
MRWRGEELARPPWAVACGGTWRPGRGGDVHGVESTAFLGSRRRPWSCWFWLRHDLSPAIIRVGGVIETKESNRNCGGAPWIRSRRGRVARDRMGERHVCTGLALGEVHVKGPNNSRSTRQCLVRQRWPFRGDVTSFSRLKFQHTTTGNSIGKRRTRFLPCGGTSRYVKTHQVRLLFLIPISYPVVGVSPPGLHSFFFLY